MAGKIAVPDNGFDVTCVIGRVEYGGDIRADVAAFMLIAEHNAPGVYSFPGIKVTVEHDESGR